MITVMSFPPGPILRAIERASGKSTSHITLATFDDDAYEKVRASVFSASCVHEPCLATIEGVACFPSSKSGWSGSLAIRAEGLEVFRRSIGCGARLPMLHMSVFKSSGVLDIEETLSDLMGLRFLVDATNICSDDGRMERFRFCRF